MHFVLVAIATATAVLIAVVAPARSQARRAGAAQARVNPERPEGGRGHSVAGLGVSARLAGDARFAPGAAITLTVELVNGGKKKLTVRSHIATHESHYDGYTVRLTYPIPSKEGCSSKFGAGTGVRELTLLDARDKSAPVFVALAPGKKITHVIDVAAWAAREINGGKPLAPGVYKLSVRYHVSEKGVWNGDVTSAEVGFTITGTPPAGVCADNPGWDAF